MLALIAAVLGACSAAIPLASPGLDAQAKLFEPVPEKAVLYVVQNGGYEARRALFQVFVDGRAVGSLTGWTFHRLVIEPGEHSLIASSPENELAYSVSLDRGAVRFVGLTSKIGWTDMRVGEIRELSNEQGHRDVSQARLALGFQREHANE